MRTNQIAAMLKKRGLIRSKFLFKVETKLRNKPLKASTYILKKNMSLRKIVKTIGDGNHYNPDVVKITFKEGETIKKYALEIATNTDNTYDDVIEVINNKEYLKKLINKYYFLTDDILNDELYFGLEGYLAPDTYEFKNKKVKVEKIIEDMLNETKKRLDNYKDKIESSNKSYHEILTLASITELEGTNKENMKMIVGIFNNRLLHNMNLGSDVTTYYGLQVEMKRDLTPSEFATVNPYNTRSSSMRGKLPVGPISCPGKEAIEAAVNPTDSDYLFFVADKKGKVYYTKTVNEHDNKVKELKEAGLWIW